MICFKKSAAIWMILLTWSNAQAQQYSSPTLQSPTVLGTLTLTNPIVMPGLPDLSASVDSSGIPGLYGASGGVAWEIYNAPPLLASPGVDINSSLTVICSPTGSNGTAGYQPSALQVVANAPAGDKYNELGIIATLNNSTASSLGTNSVAIWGQANKNGSSPVGATWAGVFATLDNTGVASPTGGTIGIEVDAGVPGTVNGGADTHGSRILQKLVASGGAGTHVGYGLQIGAYNSGAYLDTAICLAGGCAGGNGLIGTGINFTNNAFSVAAILMSAAEQQSINWQNASGVYNGSTAVSDFFTAFTNEMYFDQYDSGTFHFRGVSAASELDITPTAIVAHAPLSLPVYTIAALPTCNSGADGYVAWVKDTVGNAAPSFHGNVTGGGSTSVDSMVSCNGSASQWVYN